MPRFFKLRIEHEVALSRAARETFLVFAADHLKTNFPHLTSGPESDMLDAAVARAYDVARRHGLRDRSDILHFMEACLLLDDPLDGSSERHDDLVRLLSDKAIPASDRAWTACIAAAKRHQQHGGSA